MRVLTTCLAKCGEVLEQSAGVFAGVQESSLLREICEVEEGRNKLRGGLVTVEGHMGLHLMYYSSVIYRVVRRHMSGTTRLQKKEDAIT